MINNQPGPTRFCHQCGRPLKEAEEAAGYICVECQTKRNQRGLLPGAAWTNVGASPVSHAPGSGTEGRFDAQAPGGVQSEQATASEARSSALPNSGAVEYDPAANDSSSQANVPAQGSPSALVDEVTRDQSAPLSGAGVGAYGQGSYGPANLAGEPSTGAGGPQYPRALWPAPGSHEDYSRQYWPYPPPESLQPDPDNPPWRWLSGFGVWLFSVAAILVTPLIGALAYILYENAKGVYVPLHDAEQLQRFLLQPAAVLWQVISTFVAHILTILVVWAVVTRFGKRSFFETLGFKWEATESFRKASLYAGMLVPLGIEALVWSGIVQELRDSGKLPRGQAIGVVIFLIFCHAVALFAVWAGVTQMGRRPFLQTVSSKWNELIWLQKVSFILGVVVAMIAIEVVLGNLLPESRETDFEKLLKTSQMVRTVLAALAVISAPLVEEGVYRGVLYSGLRRAAGMWSSVAIVTVLFGLVHFPQYWGSWSGLSSIMILSFTLTVIRATTRSLMPCFVVHTLYNCIGALAILGHGGK